MPENLEQMLQQAGNATPPAPPSEPARKSGPGGAVPSTPEGSPSPGGPPAEDELPGGLREYLVANPGHKEVVDLVNREMKSAWTPRLQEAAELRKQMEGLDRQTIDQVRQIAAAAKENPQAVAQYLRQYADSLAPQAPPPADPYGGVQPQTPAEEMALKKLGELEQWKQQTQQQFEQQSLAAQAQQVNAELNKVGEQYGIDLSLEDRARAWDIARSTGVPIGSAIYTVAGDRIVLAAAQKAREEAAGIVQTKASASAGNPGSIVPRSIPPENGGKRDFKSIMAQTKEEMGIT